MKVEHVLNVVHMMSFGHLQNLHFIDVKVVGNIGAETK